MNMLSQYLKERQRRVAQLPVFRWWLGENLGKGLFGMGFGLWIGVMSQRDFLFEAGVALMIIGTVFMFASASRKSITVHTNKPETGV